VVEEGPLSEGTMTIYVVMEQARGYDQQRGAFLKEVDADAERDRLDKALPSSDGFYVESMEVKE